MSEIIVTHPKLNKTQITGYASYVALLAMKGCSSDKKLLLGYVDSMVYTAIVSELSCDDPDSRVVDDCHRYYNK